jgi:hypothetical protein
VKSGSEGRNSEFSRKLMPRPRGNGGSWGPLNDHAKPAEQMIVGLKRKPCQPVSSMPLFGSQTHVLLECAEKRFQGRLQVYMFMLGGTPLYVGMSARIARWPRKKHFRRRRLMSQTPTHPTGGATMSSLRPDKTKTFSAL